MKIDIIIPVYNGGKYIGEALESVFAQDCSHSIGIIVVDDGSTDDTRNVLDNYLNDIQYFYKENEGCYSARNLGIEKSDADLIAFVDADDLIAPEKLEYQATRLIENPCLDAVFGQAVQFLSPELDQDEHKHRRINKTPFAYRIVSNMMSRRALFSRVGKFKEVTIGSEIDWMIRARELNIKEECPNQLFYYRRVHETNTTLLRRESRSGYAKILKEKLNRARRSQS